MLRLLPFFFGVTILAAATRLLLSWEGKSSADEAVDELGLG